MFADIFLSSDEADPIHVLNLSKDGSRPMNSRGAAVLPDTYRTPGDSIAQRRFYADEDKRGLLQISE